MAERTEEVMKTSSSQKRWDEWMFLAQARTLPTFTERQFDVIKVPENIIEKLRKNFFEKLPTATYEAGTAEDSGVEGYVRPLFFPQEELNYEVLHEMTPFFEEWAGVKLEPTSVYGVRLYQNGSTLRDHLDVPETHVISGILHIASDLDEPYPIQIEDGRGQLASFDLQPGDMMFYESAKCFHQRKYPMKGRYYGSIFMHYRPYDWTYTRTDFKFAIPPWWADGLPNHDSAPAQTPRAELSDRQGDAANLDGEPESLTVTFLNNGAIPVAVYWRDPMGHLALQAKMKASEAMAFETFPGHSFVALPADMNIPRNFNPADAIGQWTIQAADAGADIPLFNTADFDEL